MKIKRKVQKNLPQLIEWAWKNDVKGENFPTDQNEEAGIYFATNSDFMMNNADYIRYNNTFTVEVEEEITEDTPLSMIIECDEDSSFWMFENTTLKNLHGNKCVEETTKYYRDDEENMHIIWRDGKLVE